MKVDQQSLAYIQTVVATAQLAKISSVIIEPGRVRAVDDNRTVVLLHEKNVPDLPFGSIGLSRIDVFSSRLNISKSFDNFEIAVTVEDSNPDAPFARALTMKGKGVKVDYRCSNPATIQAPKVLNDKMAFRIQMTPEAVLLMQQAATAMGADELSFIGDDKGVSFEVADVNSDKLTFQVSTRVDKLLDDEESPTDFAHKYPIKTITSLFKTNPDGYFFIGARGILKINVNGLDIAVLPRV